jgi:hypothetical protein
MAVTETKFATIARWCEISGMGRSSTYQCLAAGRLRGRKLGKRLLIDVEHGMRMLRSLPPADIRLPNSRRRSAFLEDATT